MTIMAILLALGIFGVQKSIVNARDSERRSDVETIARGLEERYKNGNQRAVYTGSDVLTKSGQYPGNVEMWHASGFDNANFSPRQIPGGYMTDLLSGTSGQSLTSPSGGSLDLSCIWACNPLSTSDPAYITNYVQSNVMNNDKYVYVPSDANGNICCCSGCVRFELYYKNETNGTLMKVSSKNQ